MSTWMESIQDPDGDLLTFEWRLIDILPGSELTADSIQSDTAFPTISMWPETGQWNSRSVTPVLHVTPMS